MKHKKLLSLLLAVCMVLSILPAIAYADTKTDTIDNAFTEVTGTSYTEWSDKAGDSGAVYAGKTAGANSSVQLRSSGSDCGIVTTGSAGNVTKIAVTWNSNTASGRTLNVYGKDSAYSAASDLYNSSNRGTMIGTIVYGTSTELNITDSYTYIGFCSASGAMYLDKIEITWSADGEVPQPETYTVSFDAGEGSGEMADQTTTGSVTLPTCTFTAPEGYEFAGWKMDGDDTVYAAGATVTVSADTTFTAQWSLIPVVTYTDMMLKRAPANGDVVVVYYPAAGKVMTGTEYYYNNKKYELVAADATLTDDVLAVPDDAVRLTVSVADGKYTFATADGKYLLADGTNVQLVDEQGANTLFQLETAAAGTDNWYIKCDTATYNNKAQYIEYYSGYFTVYGMGTNAAIYTFQFFSEDGEGPTPAASYTVTLDPGTAEGDLVTIEDAESTYTLPECPFTAPEGMAFAGWKMSGDDTIYKAGEKITLTGDVMLVAQWKELNVKSYTLVTSADDLSDGDTVIVVGVYEGKAYALAQQWSNNRRAVEITLDGNQALVDVDLIATEKVDDYLVRELTIGGDAENGWTFLDPLEGGYLYAASSSANYMKTQETNDDNGVFALTFGEDGAIVAVAQGTNSNKYFRFNTSGIFSCYSENSSVQNPIYIYKYVEETPVEIEDGFYLIGPDWTVESIDTLKVFGENLEASGEYLLSATLAEGDEIKVVKVENGAITAWYPDGLDTQYTVDAAHAGDVTIYFQETYKNDWSEFGGYFYIAVDYAITYVSGENGLVSGTLQRASVGTTVTLNIQPEEGYELDTLTVMCGETEIETTKVSDTQYTFVMPAGSVTVTATFTQPATEPSFRTQSLLLSGQIGLKFHMDLPELEGVDYSESYMTFAIEHGTVTERAELDGDSFTCFVNAMQMAEPITATFHYGDGLTIEKTYSVKDYFTAFDEAVEDGTISDENTIALAHAVADYGHYVQIFQAEIKGWTLSEHYAVMDKFYTESYDLDTIKTDVAGYAISKNITGDEITAITNSLIVDSETAVRVYFKVDKSYSGAFDVTVDGASYTATRIGNRYLVEINNIKASKLVDTHTIEVQTDNGTASVEVSALSYVKSMLDAYETEAPQNAAAAIYSYAMAAQTVLSDLRRR